MPVEPVKVILGDVEPTQTAVVPLMVAVGNGFTVIVTVPAGAPVQPESVVVVTLFVKLPMPLAAELNVTTCPEVDDQ